MQNLKESIISTINFKIDNYDILAYEFQTTEDIWIEEADTDCSLFRLQIEKENNETFVYVAWENDYDISEDVTHLFDTKSLLRHLKKQEQIMDIPDYTASYEEYLKEQDKETSIINTKQELMTEEEKIKCQLLFEVFQQEVEYSFDLNYRDDLSFSERVEGFKKYFEELSHAPIKTFFENYGDDFFSESLNSQYQNLLKKELEKSNFKTRISELVETLNELNNQGCLNKYQKETLEKIKEHF